jgi:hypothetical protein
MQEEEEEHVDVDDDDDADDDDDCEEEAIERLRDCVGENRVEDALALLASIPRRRVRDDEDFHQQLLHTALENDSETLVKALLAHGADVFGVTRRGTSCLEYAFCYCSPALFALTLHAPGVTLDELLNTNNEGQTLLGLMASAFMDGDYMPRQLLTDTGEFTDAWIDMRNDNVRLLFETFPAFTLDGRFSVPYWLTYDTYETGDDTPTCSYSQLAKLAAGVMRTPRLLECAALIEAEQAHRLWETSLRRAWLEACVLQSAPLTNCVDS